MFQNVSKLRYAYCNAVKEPRMNNYTYLCEDREWSNSSYYDTKLARKCHKFLRQPGKHNLSCRIVLFPEEEWAHSAAAIQWNIKVNRWWRCFCTVTEVCVGKATSADARIKHNHDGTLTVRGRFKRHDNPDFRLHLTARISLPDHKRGYLMTGALQLGDLKGNGQLKITHFAAVSRQPNPQ